MKKLSQPIKSIVASLLFLLPIFILSCGRSNHYSDQRNQQQIDSLINQAEDSISSNIPFVRAQAKLALKLVKDSMQFHEILALSAKGYLMSDSYDTAYTYSKRIVTYCNKRSPTPRTHNLLAMAYDVLGIYQQRVGSLDSSILYFKRAYQQQPLVGDMETLPNILINLADTYMMKGDIPNSALYFRKALFTSDSLNITHTMGFPIYFGLGQLYMGLRDFDLSDHYFRLAEKTFNQRTLGERFTYCNNRGNYFYYKEEYTQALPWFKKARALVFPIHQSFSLNLCELNMSDIYLKLNQVDSAAYYANRCYQFFSSINQRTALFYLTTIKAGIAMKRGNAGLAHSLLKSNNDTSGIEPNMLTIRNKCLQDYYAQVGNYRLAYHFLQRNNHIENAIKSERVKKRVSELDMRYKQDTTLLHRNLLIQSQKSKMETLQFSRLLWVLVSLIVLILATAFYFYMRKQHDLQRVRHFDQVVKLRMESIRNRISPHFIFNVLNREMVASGDEKQMDELRALVKLLRKSLEISEQLSVTLEQELEFVKTFISLETKSFGDSFNLTWDMDGAVDYEKFLVPSMIVQIPVENAIKHALRGKEGIKELHVSVKKREKNIAISIMDNGSGYHPSVPNSRGTGTGLKVIYQTIQLLNAKNKEQITFSISSLTQEKLGGTGVDILIPFSYSYEV